MAFTAGNDINVLQSSDGLSINAAQGNDTYIIAAGRLSTQQEITINDVDGDNQLILLAGLTITEASLNYESNTLSLGFDDQTQLNIQQADTLTYVLGSNPFNQEFDQVFEFSSFVDMLETAHLLPNNTQQNPDETINAAAINVLPTAQGSKTLFADEQTAELFWFDLPTALQTVSDTQLVLYDFNPNADQLMIDLITLDSSISTLDQLHSVAGIEIHSDISMNTTQIRFGADASGDIITLELSGITEPAAINIAIV
jgi:hypothetical protein